MVSRNLPGVAACVAAIAAGLWAASPAAAAESGQASYRPVQSISYEFGAKSVSGYFVQQAQTCVVTLLVAEKDDPEQPLPPSPARVRLVLNPGQIAGLDSEQGRSLNLTCGEGAATLLVDVGDTDKLVAAQGLMVPKDFANKAQ
ncbi:MAG TPA: hypothetical protein VLV76_04835 [Candidatus Acidoferrum sp.]|nr:hypothetical protein [Candidatus Acidoferrum sp.]